MHSGAAVAFRPRCSFFSPATGILLLRSRRSREARIREILTDDLCEVRRALSPPPPLPRFKKTTDDGASGRGEARLVLRSGQRQFPREETRRGRGSGRNDRDSWRAERRGDRRHLRKTKINGAKTYRAIMARGAVSLSAVENQVTIGRSREVSS